MTEAHDKMNALLKAREELEEFFEPHIQRKLKHYVELGKIPAWFANQYKRDFVFDEEFSDAGTYYFGAEGMLGDDGVAYGLTLDDAFILDPEGAEEAHRTAMQAQEDLKAWRRRKTEREEIERLESELARRKAQLEEGQ